MTSPSRVNLKALETRFRTTFSHMSRSTKTGSGRGGQSTTSRSPAFSQADRKLLASSAVSTARSVGSYDARARPASIREKSSRVLTSFSSRSPLRWAVSSRSRWPGGSGSSASARASSTGPSIRVSGVRNSWLTFEKNAVFARSISASASARRRSASCARASASAVPI